MMYKFDQAGSRGSEWLWSLCGAPVQIRQGPNCMGTPGNRQTPMKILPSVTFGLRWVIIPQQNNGLSN